MSRRTRIRLSCVHTDAIERSSLIKPLHVSLKLLGFPAYCPLVSFSCMAILFTGTSVLISFASKMCFGLFGIGQRGLKGNTAVLIKRRSLEHHHPSMGLLYTLHYSKEMGMSGKPCVQNFNGGTSLKKCWSCCH